MINFGNGCKIEYTYAADGRKLRERIKQPGQSEVKGDYPLGGLYYRDNGLVYISTAEGRVLQVSSTIDINTGKVLKDFRYEYYLKDHLGNVRFLFTDTEHTLINNGIFRYVDPPESINNTNIRQFTDAAATVPTATIPVRAETFKLITY